MEHFLLFILVGLVCGIFSALFGVGSGIILVPMLVLAFGFPQKSAQGICLAAMVPMALAGAIRYGMNPDIPVDWRASFWLAVGGVAGAVVGASLVGYVSGTALRKAFAVIMVVAAVRMFLPRLRVPNPGWRRIPAAKRRLS